MSRDSVYESSRFACGRARCHANAHPPSSPFATAGSCRPMPPTTPPTARWRMRVAFAARYFSHQSPGECLAPDVTPARFTHIRFTRTATTRVSTGPARNIAHVKIGLGIAFHYDVEAPHISPPIVLSCLPAYLVATRWLNPPRGASGRPATVTTAEESIGHSSGPCPSWCIRPLRGGSPCRTSCRASARSWVDCPA